MMLPQNWNVKVGTWFNPIKVDNELKVETKNCVVGGASRAKVLANDCRYICSKLPTIFVLPGWQKSTGAKMEVALGKALGLTIKYLRKNRKLQTKGEWNNE
jgi:hypothetical protein